MESRRSSKSSEQGNEEESSYSLGAIVAGAAAGIGLLAWGLSALASSAGEKEKKMMKAPGKDEIIEREEFQRDPKGYFRGLRGLSAHASSVGEEEKKMMKAPGKDEIIEREEFQRDPKGYFRRLRNK